MQTSDCVDVSVSKSRLIDELMLGSRPSKAAMRKRGCFPTRYQNDPANACKVSVSLARGSEDSGTSGRPPVPEERGLPSTISAICGGRYDPTLLQGASDQGGLSFDPKA